jgi:two-component system, sensor histidine kinase and response regulator
MSNNSKSVLTGSETLWSPAAVLEQLGGDDALLREIVALFLADCPVRIEQLRSALQAKDGEAIRRAAHALKGSVANFTTEGPTTTAAAIEQLGAVARIDEATVTFERLDPQLADLMGSMRRFLETSSSVQ